MKYSDQLKDPRWQRKKNGILDRDKYTCQLCQATDKTLHVHHKFYLPKLMAWEYADDCLLTLCFECHHKEGIAMQLFNEAVRELLCAGFIYAELLEQVNLFKHTKR